MYSKQKINDSIWYDPRTGEFIRNPPDEKIFPEKNKSLPDPEIVFFKSDAYLLTDETPAIISWEVENASVVTINKQPVAPSGRMPFHSSEPQAITLVAKNGKGKTATKSMWINIDSKAPVIHFFRSDKPFAIKGQPVSLSWEITGAQRVYIDNGVGDVSGRKSKTISSSISSIYQLTAENSFGNKSCAELTITVFPTPLIENLFLPQPEIDFQFISNDQPTFNLSTDVHASIQVSMPAFSGLDEFTRLDKEGAKILLQKKAVDSILFPNIILQVLVKKHKEISYIIKSVWKKKIKEQLIKTVK